MNQHPALQQAEALLDLRRPWDVLELLRGVYVELIDDPGLHCLMGWAHLQLGEHEEALAAGRATVVHAPEHESGHRICAQALLGLDRLEEALEAALRAVRLAPEGVGPQIVLSRAHQAVGDLVRAVAAARRAVALDPEYPDAHIELGSVLLSDERPVEALSAYERALALDPQNPFALNGLATARLQTGRRGTVEAFEAAMREDPDNWYARYHLLHIGAAGRILAYRRWSVGSGIMGLLAIPEAAADPASLITCAGAVVGFELIRVIEVRRLSAPTRRLLAADCRARRFKPQFWDSSWLPGVLTWPVLPFLLIQRAWRAGFAPKP